MTTEIYKLDTKGKTRVWSQEQDGSRYRTIAGILGGNLVTSEWTTCVGKQGRTDEEQATFEVAAAYKNKLTREYHSSIEAIAGGAHFFKPMLAQTWEASKFVPGYVQPKSDGMRCIATAAGLFSRQGKPIISVPHLWEALRGEFEAYPDIIFDGEIYSTALSDDFGQIMSLARQSKPTSEDLQKSAAALDYHVYDLPTASGGFGSRSETLEQVLDRVAHPSIIQVPTAYVVDLAEYDAFHAQCIEDGYEGSMFRLDSPYEQKRSKSLLKRKSFFSEEFELVSIEEGQGNWSGKAKAVQARLPDGRVFGAGIKGTAERAVGLLGESHKVVTIRYFEMTPDGIPRFGVATDFHENGRVD